MIETHPCNHVVSRSPVNILEKNPDWQYTTPLIYFLRSHFQVRDRTRNLVTDPRVLDSSPKLSRSEDPEMNQDRSLDVMSSSQDFAFLFQGFGDPRPGMHRPCLLSSLLGQVVPGAFSMDDQLEWRVPSDAWISILKICYRPWWMMMMTNTQHGLSN